MLFSSLVFLFGFLPCLLLIYYAAPRSLRNPILLFSSLIFYAWGGVSYTLILICSIPVNYFFAKQIEFRANQKVWLIAGLSVNILLIATFKYLDFFVENLNSLNRYLGTGLPDLPYAHILLPLGISFFTFQQMSMLWDIYRDKESNHTAGLLNSALYIGFFPQLIAGPIVRYHDIIDQIRSRKESLNLFASGIERFILGLFKKVIIANNCALIADGILDGGTAGISTSTAWLAIIAYAFQIYFDFSGYSDMAIGLARMFGFRLLENFNFPYTATSIREFWRRWHISLSTWFRDYVYIPLGGSRGGALKTYGNLVLVFLLTGFWHGATWSFVFWGAFHGAFLVIERLGFDKVLHRTPKFFAWLYAMFVVVIGWVFFRIESFSEAWNYTLKLFGIGASDGISFLYHLDNERILVLILAVLSSSFLPLRAKAIFQGFRSGRTQMAIHFFKDFALLLLLVYCTMYINSGSYNPFIYFRF